ncbi:MAG: hypothetical protein IH626_01810 [Rhodospirillales bacterium]|nr:hypothetical protein [Rhodospirillales bacterium]
MKMIRIIAKPAAGFRRAGMYHPAKAVDHPADDITAKQLKALKEEPQLVVQEVEVPDKPAAKSDDGKPTKTNKNP